MNFGERLKQARKNKRLTQLEVARIIGIDDTTISKYENNKSEPDNETLNKLVDLYNIKVDWLHGRENASTVDSKILAGFKKLSDKDQLYILDLIERLEPTIATKKE
ncbi:HTH-type transcriptional regulator ImmR [Paenibacillus plantiphilus]|uniref:HTH-type transcriptional regulator ImmR n=1 Tax=Paenibacillus plantiphilus TaxID=2905650 RepID=A0ABN8FQP4_9BACL|nr:helix-turn-helix transcriptional regulator [Paenibacillus plantiphilus]CAH1190376.1 HTH-type transcriptional regulator ImmR [Paenibacillus plantiphilus]